MRDLSDPEYIAKILEASRVMNPRYIEIHEGSYVQNDEGGCRYYGGFRLVIQGAPPPIKVIVDPPKPAPAKKRSAETKSSPQNARPEPDA